MFEAIDYLQKSIDKSQRELQELRGEVGSEVSGLPEILAQATTAASNATDALSVLTAGADRLEVINEHAGNAATSSANAFEALTAGADRLAVINEHAGNAATSAADALSALTAGADRLEVINEHAGNAATSSANAYSALTVGADRLAVINEHASNAATSAADALSALTAGADRLEVINEHAGNAATSAADAFEALTAGADRLEVIRGHAGNAATRSGEVQSAIGTDGNIAVGTVFGRIADVRGAIGSYYGDPNSDAVLPRIYALYRDLTVGDSSLVGTLRLQIGNSDQTSGNGGSLHAKVARILEYTGFGDQYPFSLPKIKDAIGSSGDTATTGNPSSLSAKVWKVQEMIGTPSPLSGIHLWMSDTFALMIAQARADEMLDRNCTPEPLRSLLRAKMTDITSDLRPDRPTQTGSNKRTWTQRGSAVAHLANTFLYAQVVDYGIHPLAIIGSSGDAQVYEYDNSGNPLPTTDYGPSVVEDIDASRATYADVDGGVAPNYMTFIIRLSGAWECVGPQQAGASGTFVPVIKDTKTNKQIVVSRGIYLYTNGTTTSERYGNKLVAFPVGVEWHMITTYMTEYTPPVIPS
ncbi:MAG: hypothetical protein LBJ69_00110 [Holosporales bacterium]|nr:hypothetical protein [Holosporales bacterium]